MITFGTKFLRFAIYLRICNNLAVAILSMNHSEPLHPMGGILMARKDRLVITDYN
jgi:hypothetical protein